MDIPFSFEYISSHRKVCATWRFLLYSDSIVSSSNESDLRNQDDECFKWAITRALNPVEKNSERIDIKLREKSEVLNWEGLRFAVNLSDVNKFENRNSSILIMYWVTKN